MSIVYYNNGLSFRSVSDGYKINGVTVIYTAGPGEVVFSAEATPTQLAAAFPGYSAALAAAAGQQALTNLLSQGIVVISTGTSALNGTYGVDPVSIANMTAVQTGIASGQGLPGGGSTFSYLDVTGAAHSFTATNFTNFAVAVRNFLYVAEIAAPTNSAMPSNTLTIP